MNVSLITMPEHDAKVAFEEYREAVKARHTDEDEAILRGYRELKRGRQLIDIAAAIKHAGLDELGRPRLGDHSRRSHPMSNSDGELLVHAEARAAAIAVMLKPAVMPVGPADRHVRKCGWVGTRDKLKDVPEPRFGRNASRQTCPQCGAESFYVKKPGEKPPRGWHPPQLASHGMKKPFRSVAIWPAGTFDSQGNRTTDDHFTYAEAQSVCRQLARRGAGGTGRSSRSRLGSRRLTNRMALSLAFRDSLKPE